MAASTARARANTTTKDTVSTRRTETTYASIQLIASCPGQYQGYQQQQGQPQQQSQAPKPTPTIAKRPTEPAASSAEPTAKVTVAKEGGTKVLSIGGDAPKPKAKVLTIGGTAPAKEEPKKDAADSKEEAKPEEGAKVTAAKAIEKTGEKTASKETSSGRTSPTPSSGRSSPSRAAATKAATRDAAAVEQEQSADVDEDTLKEMYGKEHVNIIFIGHVDAGKSTLGGSILVVTGMVDQRTLEKYKKEARDMVRDDCFAFLLYHLLTWILEP